MWFLVCLSCVILFTSTYVLVFLSTYFGIYVCVSPRTCHCQMRAIRQGGSIREMLSDRHMGQIMHTHTHTHTHTCPCVVDVCVHTHHACTHRQRHTYRHGWQHGCIGTRVTQRLSCMMMKMFSIKRKTFAKSALSWGIPG